MVSIITCLSSHLPSSSTEVYTVLTIDIHTVEMIVSVCVTVGAGVRMDAGTVQRTEHR